MEQKSTSLMGIKRFFAEQERADKSVTCNVKPIFEHGELTGVNIESVDGRGQMTFYRPRTSIFGEQCYGHIAGQIRIIREDITDGNNALATLATLRALEDRLVSLFKNDNPDFNVNKFLAACTLPRIFTDTSELFMSQGK